MSAEESSRLAILKACSLEAPEILSEGLQTQTS